MAAFFGSHSQLAMHGRRSLRERATHRLHGWLSGVGKLTTSTACFPYAKLHRAATNTADLHPPKGMRNAFIGSLGRLTEYHILHLDLTTNLLNCLHKSFDCLSPRLPVDYYPKKLALRTRRVVRHEAPRNQLSCDLLCHLTIPIPSSRLLVIVKADLQTRWWILRHQTEPGSRRDERGEVRSSVKGRVDVGSEARSAIVDPRECELETVASATALGCL